MLLEAGESGESISCHGWLPQAHWYFSHCSPPTLAGFASLGLICFLTFLPTLTPVSCHQQEWVVQALVRT